LANADFNFLSVDLTAVHVFAGGLGVRLLVVFDIGKAFVEHGMYAVAGHLNVLDGTVGCEYFADVIFGYVA
jgi:hypothetical protein